ncbi:hypothetical protein Ahy_A06g028932 isoform A [Arachis hypogaea]|uniref:Uncharacterized protein n=1 Tax=Arachis hypogaea TaxID=3818 RepID=A0A445CS50_ARAHY|nr:hypothetical protein Ahy_A06g028932 isoform A [Arachis hypogaea]
MAPIWDKSSLILQWTSGLIKEINTYAKIAQRGTSGSEVGDLFVRDMLNVATRGLSKCNTVDKVGEVGHCWMPRVWSLVRFDNGGRQQRRNIFQGGYHVFDVILRFMIVFYVSGHRDHPESYNIEELTGNESKVIEMDLMLGVADLNTPEAVAAAESAISSCQPAISLAANGKDTDTDSDESSAEDDNEDDGIRSGDAGNDGRKPSSLDDEKRKGNHNSKKRARIRGYGSVIEASLTDSYAGRFVDVFDPVFRKNAGSKDFVDDYFPYAQLENHLFKIRCRHTQK